MSPARVQQEDEDDDPVTAEYDVYLTPQQQEQILLLQYPNRARTRPYNARHGAAPDSIRLKPVSNHLELDINLNTAHNFNRWQGLKWGDALSTSREIQNDTATYGLAAGFSGAKPRSAGRANIKDQADRRQFLEQGVNMGGFAALEDEGKVHTRQTLGGQVIRHGEGEEEAGKPLYFLGAFRGQELHLTKVDGTVQMRPQFHHLDAEEQRARLAASRASAVDASERPQGDPRAVLTKNKTQEESEKDKAEDRMRKLLQASEAEPWTQLEYVDEDQEEAYERFHERMFVRDVDGASKLQSGMDNDQYLDAISMPRRDSPTRRRKRRPTKKRLDEVEIDSDEEEQAAEEAAEGSANVDTAGPMGGGAPVADMGG
ncbi:hypothetical protein D0869_06690 [Hortaea werneckii]|uniref:DNA-directed RNA polymerase III subunit Rpc5 n=2 Tax=Hortaea werneckii TaxID=91943 RepID=A0A3M7EQS8_HORWE|nr:hypothetical protein KC324_g8456 [Hortaea werneckii]KAI7370521.1 hypothetical protein KC354_g1218 [Hortaea werneckii]KAI7550589.1 hypothetical protein KC331_g3086 [Hortaea werneckii]KAI7593423.1 hypothetical protein KC316_g1741 [Hortaea werneckii]KAI7711927.1 hypothetical protein KC353_g8632 [Hortaea werneckii]